MFKILLINQVWHHEEDDTQIEVHEVTLGELLDNPDYEIQAELDRSGWKNAKKITDRDAQIVLNKQFYIVNPGNSTLMPVDLDRLQSFHLTSLANGSTLLQEVSVKTALTEEQYKQVQTGRKIIDNQKKQQAEANRKRAEKKKAKELAQAAKVLEDHGIKVDIPKGE